jgi:hypothetical protein
MALSILAILNAFVIMTKFSVDVTFPVITNEGHKKNHKKLDNLQPEFMVADENFDSTDFSCRNGTGKFRQQQPCLFLSAFSLG